MSTFWRWASWKVFGGNPYRSGTDKSKARWTEGRGVICFITVAGFVNGPGFQKMRADLRREADEIFVVDCTPEGHQPPVGSDLSGGPTARVHRNGASAVCRGEPAASQSSLP